MCCFSYVLMYSASLPLPPDWPANGEIHIKAVSLKYNVNQDPVVSNVSLHIKPGQKVDHCQMSSSVIIPIMVASHRRLVSQTRGSCRRLVPSRSMYSFFSWCPYFKIPYVSFSCFNLLFILRVQWPVVVCFLGGICCLKLIAQ